MRPALPAARAYLRFAAFNATFAKRGQRRMLAANPNDAWHGTSARCVVGDLRLPPLLAPWVLFQTAETRSLLRLTAWKRWWLFTPTPAQLSAAARRLRPWAQAIARGLGGLVRLKLRYKGKSFRWHRRKRGLLLRFGHSHLVHVPLWPGVRRRHKGRMKMLLFGSNLWELRHFAGWTIRWRQMNVYHGRGLRLARQRVFRKAGKVSAYR